MDIYLKKGYDKTEPTNVFNDNVNRMEFKARIKSIQFGDDSSYIGLELIEASTSHRKTLTLGAILNIREKGYFEDWNNEIVEAIYTYSSDDFDPTTRLTESLIPSRLVGEIFTFVFNRENKSEDWELIKMTKYNESYHSSDLAPYHGKIVSVSATYATIEIVFKLALSKMTQSFYLGDLHKVYHYDLQNEAQEKLFLSTFDEFLYFDTQSKSYQFSNDDLMIITPRKKVNQLGDFYLFDEHDARPIQVCKLDWKEKVDHD